MVVGIVVEPGNGEHELVESLHRGEPVERDDAGGGDAGDVAGRRAFGLGVHLDGQLGRVDEAVAPQAAAAGGEEPVHGVDLADVAVLSTGILIPIWLAGIRYWFTAVLTQNRAEWLPAAKKIQSTICSACRAAGVSTRRTGR